MKKNLLIVLLATVSISIFSCQKNFAPIQKSSGIGYQSEKKSIPLMSDAEFNDITVSKTEKISNQVEVSKPEPVSTPLVIQNSEKIELTKEQKQLIRKENSVKFDNKIIEAQTGKKLSFVQKTALKKLEKKANAVAGSGKSQLIALLLVIFVGALGIHRFYLGYTTYGIIQLLTAGGCGVWALIDLIRIITGDLKPNGGNYDETL